MPKKAAGENSKKAVGQARKAEAAASKQAAKDKQAEETEAKEWSKGSKSTAKADAAAAKAAEAARKKAEKDALLKEEEASLPSKAKSAGAKTAQKKGRGIDSVLGSLDNPSELNATGIDNALDALSLTSKSNDKIDRHPERRFRAALAAFQAKKMEEKKEEYKFLTKHNRDERIRKEFEKAPENPFNQMHGAFNSTPEQLAEKRESERLKMESRLGSPTS